MSGLLQSLHLLITVRSDKSLDSDEFAGRRLSNGHSDVTIKLELVDFLTDPQASSFRSRTARTVDSTISKFVPTFSLGSSFTSSPD